MNGFETGEGRFIKRSLVCLLHQKTSCTKKNCLLLFFNSPHSLSGCPIETLQGYKAGDCWRKMSLNTDPASNGSQGRRYIAVCACQQWKSFSFPTDDKNIHYWLKVKKKLKIKNPTPYNFCSSWNTTFCVFKRTLPLLHVKWTITSSYYYCAHCSNWIDTSYVVGFDGTGVIRVGV